MYTKEHDALRPPSRQAVTTADQGLNIQLKQMANRMRVTTLGNVTGTVNVYRGSRGIAPLILSLGTDGGK